jgi:hypothetical protein
MNPYDSFGAPQAHEAQVERPQKHSGVGIASFIISLLTGAGLFLSFAAAGVLEASTPGGIDEQSPEAVAIGLAILGGLFVDLVALTLGVGGLCQDNRKKIFALLGALFSGLALAATVGLVVLGAALG